MKPVQILMDEDLLEDLDADEQVQRFGRSRVLRRLVADYLERRHEAALDASYAAGYGNGSRVAEELEGWDEEGTWPEE